MIARTPSIVLRALSALLIFPAVVAAKPDLRQPRPAGSLTVYPDDARGNLFYYPPGEIAIARRDDGSPDVHLLLTRYTGTVVTRDQGSAVFRSVLTLHVVLDGPTPAQLSGARQHLVVAGAVELRPLPIRRLVSAIVYAPIAAGTTTEAPAAAQPLPPGHFEAAETAAPTPTDGFWSDRVYTLRLSDDDAQLLSAAFAKGQVALSLGYAFIVDGAGPDHPLQDLSGSAALVAQLRQQIAATAPAAVSPAVVRAGAVAVTPDTARWPRLVQRIDINESLPPGYAALDVYCYDFTRADDSPLYEKQVEIEAGGVGGRPVTLTTTFTRSQADLFARSLRFPVAVRLDRPYRYRVVEIAQDGTSATSAWKEQTSWTALLDVTAQGDPR